MPPKKSKEKSYSPYQVLNRWLYDGSKQTQLPKELEDDKAIPTTILLYHFQASKYILYLSELFNNFDMYQMRKKDVFRFLKQCILLTGYKPPFIQKVKTQRNKLAKILRMKFPYLKLYEIDFLIETIDQSPEKDRIYETVGLYAPKKKKSTKADKAKLEKANTQKAEAVSLDDVMNNFK